MRGPSPKSGPTISQPSVGARVELDRALAETPSQFLSVLMTPITFCPPAAARGSESDHQFVGHEKHTVNTHFEAEGAAVSDTGIGWDDFEHMQTSTHRTHMHHRTGIPEWTRSTALTRAVLVRFFEERAFSRKQLASLSGTEAERLTRACEKLRANASWKLASMDRLCNELVTLKQSGGDREREKVLVCQISGIDTQVRMAQQNWPAVILGIIYQSYNVGLDSVGVAAMFGVKPPGVRQTLWRLNQTWKMMNDPRSTRSDGSCTSCGGTRPNERWKQCEKCRVSKRKKSAANAARAVTHVVGSQAQAQQAAA